MVKANELRGGNKISLYGNIETIYGINSAGEVKLNFHTNIFELDYIEPIPLTPEILEKCGFKNYPRPDHEKRKMRGLFFLNIGGMDITFHMGETLLVMENKGNIKSGQVILNKSLEYLHQLQNLYFALTGEELEIQL